jgi:hypothetical protein
MLHLFKWFESTVLGAVIRSSTYLFPAIEVLHLLGLTVLLGAIVVLDMRLLGFGLRRQSIPRVAQAMTPLIWTGIAISFPSGTLLFVAEAVKCYDNAAFWFKMACLFAAVVFQVTVHRAVTSSDDIQPLRAKFTGAVSLLLWFAVGVGGRAIGFL